MARLLETFSVIVTRRKTIGRFQVHRALLTRVTKCKRVNTLRKLLIFKCVPSCNPFVRHSDCDELQCFHLSSVQLSFVTDKRRFHLLRWVFSTRIRLPIDFDMSTRSVCTFVTIPSFNIVPHCARSLIHGCTASRPIPHRSVYLSISHGVVRVTVCARCAHQQI